MNIAFKAKKEKRDFLKEIIHNDDTIRIQSVNTDNMEMKKILDLLYLKSNIPMVINTSFNMKGSSIVRTPKDAIATFYSSEIDVLYLGDFRLEKDK